MKKARICLIDDHTMFRDALTMMIESFGHEVLLSAESPTRETLDYCGKNADLTIMDLTFPQGQCGLDALEHFHASYPNASVMILTHRPDLYFARKSLEKGAFGFLNKTETTERLQGAIDKILEGKKDFPLEIMLKMHNEKEKINLLSQREFKVFLELARGKSFKEIGEMLEISIKTVSTYRNRISQKTGLMTFSDIISYAHENHLLF
jgi:two-component system, NarL family, invasion response regulator UvrY